MNEELQQSWNVWKEENTLTIKDIDFLVRTTEEPLFQLPTKTLRSILDSLKSLSETLDQIKNHSSVHYE